MSWIELWAGGHKLFFFCTYHGVNKNLSALAAATPREVNDISLKW